MFYPVLKKKKKKKMVAFRKIAKFCFAKNMPWEFVERELPSPLGILMINNLLYPTIEMNVQGLTLRLMEITFSVLFIIFISVFSEKTIES